MKHWVTADTHFGHYNIIKHCYRPWTIGEHDDKLVDNWNSVVGKRDTVFHLGDFAMFKSEDVDNRMKAYRKTRMRLNGKVHLVIGNHDSMSRDTYDCFTKVYDFGTEVKVDGEKIVICHYPMRSWNRSFHGSMSLFGHVHGRLEGVDTGVSCDVGVDVPEWDYKPVAWEVLRAKLLKKREIHKTKYQKI